MANKVETILKPLLGSGSKYEGKVKVIVRLHVQPWHASSTLTHEAGLAVSPKSLTLSPTRDFQKKKNPIKVLRASPENFWPFSLQVSFELNYNSYSSSLLNQFYDKKLFKHQEDYFDVPSQDLTPRQIREKLAQLASNLLPSDALSAFKDLLTLKGEFLNGGTGVTNDLKYNGMSQKFHPFRIFLYPTPFFL